MRNVLVVVVLACLGLVSGFMVPSGIQEVISDVNSIQSSARRTRNILHATETLASVSQSVKSSSTENTDNGNLDTDLYEHSQSKDSDVKERAYIYINQKGKKPIRNRLYDSPVKIPQHSNGHKSYLFNMNKVFEELPRQFWIGYMTQNLQTNPESRKPDHRCHFQGNKQNKKKSDADLRTEAYKTFSNEQLEFLELLKAPLVRAEFKTSDGINLDKNKFKYLSVDRQKGDTSYIYNPPEFKSVQSDQLKNIENIKGMARDPSGKNGKKNYQFGLHNDKPLLDELIKQKLNEHGSLFGCRDCLNKVKKSKLSSRLNLDAICKCDSHLLPREAQKSKH